MFPRKIHFFIIASLIGFIHSSQILPSESNLSQTEQYLEQQKPLVQNITIREASIDDFPQMWDIFHPIVKQGDTYVFAPDTSFEQAYEYYWVTKGIFNFVAILDNKVVGMYTIKPNQSGLGSHVANASYMVHPDYQGRGIGPIMATHSLKQAKELGFKAMQFNMVVTTNTQAIKLWKKMGFNIVGTLPQVFNHQKLGYIDAYVMHRFLN